MQKTTWHMLRLSLGKLQLKASLLKSVCAGMLLVRSSKGGLHNKHHTINAACTCA